MYSLHVHQFSHINHYPAVHSCNQSHQISQQDWSPGGGPLKWGKLVVSHTFYGMLWPLTNAIFEAPDEHGFRKWQGRSASFFLGPASEFNPSTQGKIMLCLGQRAQLSQGFEGYIIRTWNVLWYSNKREWLYWMARDMNASITWVENPGVKEFNS